MTGYVSISPARVRSLVKALQDAGTASESLRTRLRDLIGQGVEAGGSPMPLIRENMPFSSGASSELRGLITDTKESSQAYTRRVDRLRP